MNYVDCFYWKQFNRSREVGKMISGAVTLHEIVATSSLKLKTVNEGAACNKMNN